MLPHWLVRRAVFAIEGLLMPAGNEDFRAFEKLVRSYDLSKPEVARGKLLEAAQNSVAEAILYGLCGFDYIKEPADTKWSVIQKEFLESGGRFELNLSGAARKEILGHLKPSLGLKTESGIALKDFATGGLRQGGVGNYNLCTKALDASAIHYRFEIANLADTIRQNSAGSGSTTNTMKIADETLSDAYNVLVGAFGDSKLTSWGITARGRPTPSRKSLLQRLGLRRP